jgi:hypothetical protein
MNSRTRNIIFLIGNEGEFYNTPKVYVLNTIYFKPEILKIQKFSVRQFLFSKMRTHMLYTKIFCTFLTIKSKKLRVLKNVIF